MNPTNSEANVWFAHYGYSGALLSVLLLLLALSLPLQASEQSLQSLYNFQSKMAAQGSGEAMIKLGEMHEDGLGTEKSDERALEWYQKALAKGHPAAQSHIDNLHKRNAEAAARQRAEQEKAAREQAAREQAVREQAAREEEAARAQAAREEAARQEATRKAMTPEEKAQAREDAIRRAEEAYQQSLKKRIDLERAESEALKRSRNAATKKH